MGQLLEDTIGSLRVELAVVAEVADLGPGDAQVLQPPRQSAVQVEPAARTFAVVGKQARVTRRAILEPTGLRAGAAGRRAGWESLTMATMATITPRANRMPPIAKQASTGQP